MKNTPDQVGISAEDRLFVLTGAGVSAESGLATFRGADGLWHGYRVEEVASPEAWVRDAELVWQFYSMRRENALKAKPNPAHHALAQLELELGDRFFLCTQNVDDLHEQAGSKRLLHMHGELFRSRCERCLRPSFVDRDLYPSVADIPRCKCRGRIRPDIVWFGEVPMHMPRILEELERCTVLLVVGTSGLVQPAASFVHWAAALNAGGGKLVRAYYVGPEAPANAAAFTAAFHGKAGEALPGLFALDRG